MELNLYKIFCYDSNGKLLNVSKEVGFSEEEAIRKTRYANESYLSINNIRVKYPIKFKTQIVSEP